MPIRNVYNCSKCWILFIANDNVSCCIRIGFGLIFKGVLVFLFKRRKLIIMIFFWKWYHSGVYLAKFDHNIFSIIFNESIQWVDWKIYFKDRKLYLKSYSFLAIKQIIRWYLKWAGWFNLSLPQNYFKNCQKTSRISDTVVFMI